MADKADEQQQQQQQQQKKSSPGSSKLKRRGKDAANGAVLQTIEAVTLGESFFSFSHNKERTTQLIKQHIVGVPQRCRGFSPSHAHLHWVGLADYHSSVR